MSTSRDFFHRFVIVLVCLTLLNNGLFTPLPTSSAGRPVSSPSKPADSGPHDVAIVDFAFDPVVVTVTVGLAVTWVNNGAVVHQVRGGLPPLQPEPSFRIFLPLITRQAAGNRIFLPFVIRQAAGNLAITQPPAASPTTQHPNSPLGANFDSGGLAPGATFTHTFDSPGVYDYHDPLHPKMLGQVVVIANNPPEVTIASPVEGAVIGVGNRQVSGTFTDDGQVVSVRVNDVIAALGSGAYTATISLSSGSQVINVVAEDNLGLTGLVSRVVFVDGDGPQIEIHTPKDRQAVYTTTPTVTIRYTDFYAAVNPATFTALLIGSTGAAQNVASDLVVTATGAAGVLVDPLAEDATYTLTVTLQDTFGNPATATTRFYVPPAPETILPPEEPPQAGWVSGAVYDSTTCDEYQTTCQGLAGARVTLEKVDTKALAAMRAARQSQIMARLNAKASFAPLAPSVVTTVTLPVTGTIVTGPDGFFAFPADETAHYWLRVEKDGYTYGQREADIVREHSAATNAIYLTQIDSTVTMCGSAGCAHTSSDGTLQVEIPAGAIPLGEVVTTTATNFEHVEYLPSGSLPPGTGETYAFNLGGSSDVTFTQPITIQQANTLGFAPGSEIPLGYWNQHTQQWEHEGFGVVDSTGQWVVMHVTHFSNWDCNYGITNSDANPNSNNQTNQQDTCPVGSNSCFIEYGTGILKEDYALPSVNIMGEKIAPKLLYNSSRADPSAVIDVELSTNPGSGAVLGNHVGFELYIQGIKTDALTFSTTLTTGEIGRFRYLWDGRDAQGNRLPAGVYDYQVKLSVPYRAQRCGAAYFGGPADCVNRPTGTYVTATDDTWVNGTVKLDAALDSSFGAGWSLNGQQRLHEDEAGRILVTDGERADEFYFPQKDLLNSAGTSSLVQRLQVTGAVASAVPHPHGFLIKIHWTMLYKNCKLLYLTTLPTEVERYARANPRRQPSQVIYG